MVRVISGQKVEEFKVSLRIQAYLGWLIYLRQPIDTREQRMTFEEWLGNLGLIEIGKKGPEDVESLRKKSLEIAEKIIEMDRKNIRS